MQRLKAILTVTAALAFALSPLAVPGFAGFEPSQFPVPQTDPPIQPAGWAFSIWGLIYLWLVGSAIFGLLRRDTDPDWDRTRFPLIVSLVLGAAWLPVARMSPLYATVLIWLMLGFALWAYFRAPARDWLELRAPVALYAGWLTAASCVSTAILVTGYGAIPVTPIHGAFLLLAVAIGAQVLRRQTNPFYALALCWALAGIIAANIDDGRIVFIGVAAVSILLLLPVAIKGLGREARAVARAAT